MSSYSVQEMIDGYNDELENEREAKAQKKVWSGRLVSYVERKTKEAAKHSLTYAERWGLTVCQQSRTIVDDEKGLLRWMRKAGIHDKCTTTIIDLKALENLAAADPDILAGCRKYVKIEPKGDPYIKVTDLAAKKAGARA
ncbi:MAG: hypothetical protein JRN42_05855 [Nitrososphaerota archaeon]|nr:hypothetical protein [Nitrososphaerota archaeon]